MSEKESSSEFNKTLKTLEEALKDKEKREKVDGLLETFAKLERRELLGRITSFTRYIEEICGHETGNALLRMLSRGLPAINKSLEQIEDAEVREWLRQLNSKYISAYEGIFPPIPHDWYRVFWSVKVDITHGNIPLIEAHILKRNGEIVYFEMPFSALVSLTNYLLGQISEAKEIDVLREQIQGLHEELEQTKKIVDSILES